MPTFFLDGEPIEYRDGETVLAAALRRGREIPHYCFHPGLKVTAQCRMCLVDVVDMGNGNGMPKLQTACSTPAANNMKVVTASDKVHQGQNTINEFILVNHPLDCPICDQAGECDLQNFAFKYGSGHSEMEYEKRVYGWRNVGSFIMLERNRCIHCSRCERFSRDIVGTHDFGVFLRSHELTFDTFEDQQITHKFQGNLADICPVGAITNRDWRFKKRAWKLRKTKSVCPDCSTGCNVTIEQHQNHIFRLKPRQNPEVNRWWMCDEGRVGFHPLNERKQRLMEPQARVSGELRTASWEAVYGALAKRFKDIGAKGAQALGLVDTHATNEELHLFRKLLADGFGSRAIHFPLRKGEQQEHPPREVVDPFIYTLITTDKSPNTAGAQAAGFSGDELAAGVRAALNAGPKIVFVLGTPFAGDEALRNLAFKAELVVHIGTFQNPWVQVADVILPGYTTAEKAGTFTNKARRVQRIAPAVLPPETARDPVRVLQELLGALGKRSAFDSAAAVFDDLASQDGPFKGLTWEGLGDQGAVLPAS
ncbi:MAG: molybdopterin-dependent oxidoreductase [Candidatus Lambdaproteobacteria bacterium]|nr:molybdopterin-dependent oxidoreductase [Candidatus Lambdaproteobacteria bacterium]